jgi:hypothetical protein
MKSNLLFYKNFMPYIPCIKSEFFVNHVKGGFHELFLKDNFFKKLTKLLFLDMVWKNDLTNNP